MQIDIDHLRQWIGREERATEWLSAGLARQFNATFDREAPCDEGDEAALLVHWCLAQPAAPTASLGPDGHPARGGFLPPVPLPRRMWAGGAFRFHAPIRVGDLVERVSTIRDVTLKQGRTGPLCFVTVDHAISANGQPALTERQDIVYREVTAAARVAPAEPAPEAPHRRRITPSATLLFRYSAMTFNGHRIHYDKPYATDVEGYPGLVVHGPMQATLLCQFAADLRGAMPERFDYRSLSPLFDDADMLCCATDEGDGLKLWTARPGGPVAMEAVAEWS
ncbi:protein dehydratase [Aliigemmobacter aestuarii]|uniref:Protein dehydratase n=1 Tax=Aliigemmobacter aestuarii TaxID=1445661 RepID=A0A4S3MQH1_9RHOB|nr:MaoC family dehydratase N-terminal domain-containing protein [Gemmobacter aestuarii]THD84699.1 protein dehydratase [Gemmobacter aestuarii]